MILEIVTGRDYERWANLPKVPATFSVQILTHICYCNWCRRQAVTNTKVPTPVALFAAATVMLI